MPIKIGNPIPVLIQFAEGPPGLLKQEQRANERANIVSLAGGFTARAYLNFPSALAMVDQKTLERLERHPLISHISFDHELHGDLYTTSRAVGADQVWAGMAGNRGVTGAGVTVAVIDSGFQDSFDLDSSRIVKDRSFVGNLDWNVSGIIGTTATPPPQLDIEIVGNDGGPYRDSNKLKWDLTNFGPNAAIITKVEVAWPEANGKLKKVKLDGDVASDPPDVVWNGQPFTVIDFDDNVSKKSIAPGKTRAFTLEFERDYKQAVNTEYSFRITYSNGDTTDWNVIGIYGTKSSYIEVVGDPAGPRLGDHWLWWSLTNHGSETAILSRVEVLWPEVQGKLKKVKLDGDDAADPADIVWNGLPAVIAEFDNDVNKKSIDPGETRLFTLEFSTNFLNELPSDYSFRITFKGGETPADQYGHGSHVAGIIGGNGYQSSPGNGFAYQYKGIAPGANLLNLKMLDKNGAGLTSDVMAALDWCIEHKDEYNIRVINVSLGHPVFESYKADPLGQAVESCVANGIVVVASAKS